jgi:hypothetical protein
MEELEVLLEQEDPVVLVAPMQSVVWAQSVVLAVLVVSRMQVDLLDQVPVSLILRQLHMQRVM